MNIIVLTCPRTGSNYFNRVYLPTQLLSKPLHTAYINNRVGCSEFSGSPIKYYNHHEIYEPTDIGYYGKYNNLDNMLLLKNIDVTLTEDTYNDPVAHINRFCKYWQSAQSEKDTINVTKLYRKDFEFLSYKLAASMTNKIIAATDEIYLLYRKDITATVYSLYYAILSGEFSDRPGEEETYNHVLPVGPAQWKSCERVVISNYKWMLAVAKQNKVKIVCLEEDLPHLPYSISPDYTNTEVVCSQGDFFHREFQKLK